uniref:Uncharacterized protein n=1 Tax=Meloidogyne enterolobii TaxID=390850 RepID=A0A6V7WB26_MELEN|nr:unnamed protein product [Meloidogyne enterolobii]
MECRYMIWIWLQWKMLNLGESLELNDGFKIFNSTSKFSSKQYSTTTPTIFFNFFFFIK